MDPPEEENTDGSSIRPVSSLRSHFENMIKSKPADRPTATTPTTPTVPPRPGRTINNASLLPKDALQGQRGRISLDLPRPNTYNNTVDQKGTASERNTQPSTPRSRPLSMGPLAPPTVLVESPRSPPRYVEEVQNGFSSRSGSPPVQTDEQVRPGSPLPPPSRGFRIPTRGGTPSLESTPLPKLAQSPQFAPIQDPQKEDTPTRVSTFPPAPPVNRAVKPKAFTTPAPRKPSETLAAPPASSFDQEDDKISPFSTPPSEPELEPMSPPFEDPPPIPEASKPRLPPQLPARDNRFVTLPMREEPSIQPSVRAAPPPMPPRHPIEKAEAPPPLLPPRKEAYPPPPVRNKSPRPPPPRPPEPPRRSMDNPSPNSRVDLSSRRQPDTRNLIPSRRPNTTNPVTNFPPPPLPPQRASGEMKREREREREPVYAEKYTRVIKHDSDEEEDATEHSPERPTATNASINEAPDASTSNRLPPWFTVGRRGPHEILMKQNGDVFAIYGDRLCTSGLHTTRGWNARTGDLLFTFTHGETVKATAVAFKPGGVARADDGNGEYETEEEEGRKIWVGTSSGELQEIDVITKAVITHRREIHGNATVIKIHRCFSNLLTLDDDGRVLIWPAESDTGAPSLSSTPYTAKILPKATFSLMVGTQLWVALGKGIWVYEYDRRQHTLTQMNRQPLVQIGCGDVTAGTTVATGSRPADRVYFGHGGVDGKVSIYSREEGYQCLGVVQVSLYPIRALAGVGDRLWAGFKTGKIYIFDVNTQPWKVVKDWRAHEDTIQAMHVDYQSVWRKTGKTLPVASMGKDGAVRFWDGLLSADWITADLREHDVEYCEFGEFTASLMTWNAGASKPASLRHDEADDNFFRDFLTSSEPPDMFVFGFQELVDLEDKRATAKSFFKAAKKHKDKDKDPHHYQDAERMSHQYRSWRDHLARCIDENMPASETYQLLHTGNLVGLFTCIFVKDSFRHRITYLDSAEIKTGMGGLHGNKGALVVRFLVDGSSICLLNCHLAAGQSNTGHRNKDLAVILDSAPLTALGLADDAPPDAFAAGGDGSMALDHEVCILSGDLNYRIDTMSRDVVIGAIRANNLSSLLARDQLLGARRRNPGHRLRAWEEKPITFAPTYKYDVGTNTYDSSEKKRSPAWCDRILYKGLGKVKMDTYRRWEAPRTSDHRPVSGQFKIRVKTVLEDRRRVVMKEGEKRFDAVVKRVAGDVMVDYLVNTLGFTHKDALDETAAALET